MTDELRQILFEGERSLRMLLKSFAEVRRMVKPILPARLDDFLNFGPEQDLPVLALFKRFEQIEDLSARMFRALLAAELEDTQSMSNRDVATRIAELGWVSSRESWLKAGRASQRTRA